MKFRHGSKTPALRLSTSQSGLTTFMCLNSRTLAGVREQVSICVLYIAKCQETRRDAASEDVHEGLLVEIRVKDASVLDDHPAQVLYRRLCPAINLQVRFISENNKHAICLHISANH